MSLKSSPLRKPAITGKPEHTWLPVAAWVVAGLMLVWLGLLVWQRVATAAPTGIAGAMDNGVPAGKVDLPLPPLASTPQSSVAREVNPRTVIPTRSRMAAVSYTVETGDAIFGIAENFSLEPESVLWANYDVLNDNPDMISVGQTLLIPPVDGVLYKWKEGDQLEKVAGDFNAEPEDILTFPGNRLDLTNPVVNPGDLVMIPGGSRAFQQWLMPTIPRGAAGVATNIAGTCNTTNTTMGSGAFIWPSASQYISGNNYWSGHLAIDIGVSLGEPVWAADSGVVVYAGGSSGGYGRMVMIDHGNGYQTLYAHLDSVSVACGQGVARGQTIGMGGSTGNSTGPHLHFEVRYLGGFINPFFVLP